MKISYFRETDTLYIELKSSNVHESKDLDENTVLDTDERGQVVAITIEHASERTDIDQLSLSGIAA